MEHRASEFDYLVRHDPSHYSEVNKLNIARKRSPKEVQKYIACLS